MSENKSYEQTTGGYSHPQQRVFSFGEKAVEITFNPGNNIVVNDLKCDYAAIIDYLNDKRSESESPDVKRMYSEAITSTQTAQMWAVKAATWQY